MTPALLVGVDGPARRSRRPCSSESTALLVGVDGSPPSLTAVAWAAETAVLTGRTLRLLFVGTPPAGYEALAGPFDERRAGAVQMLDRTARDLRSRHPGLQVDVDVLCGHAIARLLAETAGLGAA